jgi:hypothetical protein
LKEGAYQPIEMNVESALSRTTFVGGFGTTAAIMKFEATEGKLDPAALTPTTWKT